MLLTRRLFLQALPAAAVAAQWDKADFPDWPDKASDLILSDSPWSRPLTVALPSLRSEVYLTIRWSSALPVRQAVALQQFGRGGLESAHAQKVLAEPEDYVVEIFGVPAIIVQRDLRGFEKELKNSARLVVLGGPEIPVKEARVPGMGTFVSAEFRFPRDVDLRTAKGVDFIASGGGMKIRQGFKPPEMRYRGEIAV